MAGLEPVSIAFGCAMGIAISITVLAIFMGCYKRRIFQNAVKAVKNMEEGRPDMRQKTPLGPLSVNIPVTTRPPAAMLSKLGADSPRRPHHGSIKAKRSLETYEHASSPFRQTHLPKVVKFQTPGPAPERTSDIRPQYIDTDLPPVRLAATPKRVASPGVFIPSASLGEFRSSSAPPLRDSPPYPHTKHRKAAVTLIPPSPLAPRTYRPPPVLSQYGKAVPPTPTSSKGGISPSMARIPVPPPRPPPPPMRCRLGSIESRSNNKSFSEAMFEATRMMDSNPQCNTEIAELPAFDIPEPPMTDHAATIFDIHGLSLSTSPGSSPRFPIQNPSLRRRSLSGPPSSLHESPIIPPLTPSSIFPNSSTRTSSMHL